MTDTPQLLLHLRQATDGLIYMSESDAPLEVVHWDFQGELSPTQIKQLAGEPQDAPVETISLDSFLEPVATERDWHEAEEREVVAKFKKLGEILKQSLNHIQVYRIGQIEINIYILGKARDGSIVGVKTTAIET